MRGLSNDQIAREVALDLPDGGCVNLGIGMPILVASEIEADREVVLQSENGVVGMGGPARGDDIDPDLVDAGKSPIVLRTGGSFVSHSDSFSMIRGGHIDVSVMGAMQVSGSGDLANWWSGEGTPGVGGAMDLAVGARRVVVIMKHLTTLGEPKIVSSCTLPLTAAGVVSRIYTEFGIFEPAGDGILRVIGLAGELTIEDVAGVTGPPLRKDGAPVRLPRMEG